MILYRDIGVLECRLARGGLCRNTPNCIVTEMKAGECVAIHQVCRGRSIGLATGVTIQLIV